MVGDLICSIHAAKDYHFLNYYFLSCHTIKLAAVIGFIERGNYHVIRLKEYSNQMITHLKTKNNAGFACTY